MLTSILTAIHLITAISIVVLVLLQQGKGADMGAAFGGGGSSQSLFGSRGSANFLSRTTGILALVFFLTGLSLAYIYASQSGFQSATESSAIEQVEERGGVLPDIPGTQTDQAESLDNEAPDVPEGSSGGSESQ